ILSQVEESLMSMPSAEAFSILAIQEPKLRALEQKAVQLSTDIALSGKTREEMPLLLMKEINGLLDPHARTSNGILSSPIAKLIVSRHIFKLAGFVEFMEYKDWWPGGP